MSKSQTIGNVILAALFISGSCAATAHAAKIYRGKCLLQINGKKYVDGRCPIHMESDGGFTIGAAEKGPITYFAVISVSGKNQADGFWNEEKGANHAHTPLGQLTRKGACWENKHAKACAWR